MSNVKYCKQCGKPIPTSTSSKRGRSVFCSKECSKTFYNKGFSIKVCKLCGKEFQPTCSRQVYCSDECAYEMVKVRNRKHYLETHRKAYGYRKCSNCGHRFRVSRKTVDYETCPKCRWDIPNVCFVCGGIIPDKNPVTQNDYVIHKKCLSQTTLDIEEDRVYNGD